VRKTATSILLVLCLAWQSVAIAAQALAPALSDELAHSALHIMGLSHHHHDSQHDHGTFHIDNSDESADHVLADHFNSSALLPEAGSSVSPSGGCAPGVNDVRTPPHPLLEGPLRPPRLTA
jgi:hypothetical protein